MWFLNSYLSWILRHFPLDRVQTHPHERKCARGKLDGSIYRIWPDPQHKDHTMEKLWACADGTLSSSCWFITRFCCFCRSLTPADLSLLSEDLTQDTRIREESGRSRIQDTPASHLHQIWTHDRFNWWSIQFSVIFILLSVCILS